jgi:hypothetical protein
MALFDPGCPCPLCGSPININDDHIGFTYLGSYDHNVSLLDDGVVHRQCLSKWEHRNAFVEAWNGEAEACVGQEHLLEITPGGEVRYKSERHGRRLKNFLRRLRDFFRM